MCDTRLGADLLVPRPLLQVVPLRGEAVESRTGRQIANSLHDAMILLSKTGDPVYQTITKQRDKS